MFVLCSDGVLPLLRCFKVLEDERRGFVKVTNLRDIVVQNAEEALKQLRIGCASRKVEAPRWGANSRASSIRSRLIHATLSASGVRDQRQRPQNTHTYTRTHVHTYIHTHIHTYIHIHTHTFTGIHIHTHKHTQTYTVAGWLVLVPCFQCFRHFFV